MIESFPFSMSTGLLRDEHAQSMLKSLRTLPRFNNIAVLHWSPKEHWIKGAAPTEALAGEAKAYLEGYKKACVDFLG